MIEPVCDHGSTQNKVRTIFYKNTFLNQKIVFPKLVFSKLDYANGKEKCFELFSKILRNMKDVCVSISRANNLYHLGFNKRL